MSQYRFDRSKLLIGTYCLKDYAWSEQHIRDLAHAGINYLCATPADPALLDRCLKYGLGIFASGVLPGWWGGDGDNAGKLAGAVPVSSYEEAARSFVDHPAIWGLDTGDEPSALDFPHYGKLFEAEKRLFPGILPYLNLYPNYASVPENNDEECVSQLGTATYQEHIDRFAENVDCDYICYDYYMYATSVTGAYENLRVVANKCRETGRDMWIVLQVNSNRPEEWMSLNQLRHQAYTAMAFGAKAICWACWTAGWWHNEVLDAEGNHTQQYDKMCIMNRELHALGEKYMQYGNVSSHFVGFRNHPSMEAVQQAAEETLCAGSFREVSVEDGCGAVVGYMKALSGDGEALMVADGTEPTGTAGSPYALRFKTDRTPCASVNGLPTPVLCTGENEYMLRIEPCCGALIELN